MFALIAAAALSTTNLQPSPSPFHPFTLSPVHPLTTRWTFGAHEPMTMYRRMGRRSTGAIDGNALWTRDWLNWFDDHAPEKMQEMGFNYIHSRFYKGMGWEVEKKDFPNVQKFVRNCHAHGVRTLAYVQFGTLYPEMMRREIPQIDDWCGRDIDGHPNIYLGNYFRWMPCLNCREWEDYLKRMCTIALTEGGFDGIMFDNVFDVPCHCKRCERLFREWMAAIPDPEDRFGLPHVENVMLPPLKPWQKVTGRQMRDPVMQAWVEWRCETMTGLLMRLRAHIKSVKPDAQVSGNPTPYRNLADCQWKAQNMIEMSPAFDVIVMQNDNYPEVKEDRISNRVRDFKFAQDLGQTLVALCDDVENIFSDREKKFILPMMEDVIFGGIPTDRTSMFPSPEEGFLNTEVWERRQPIHRRFNDFVNAHRTELSAPTVHSVRIFYPEREILLSPETSLAIGAAEEIFLRNRVPYGYLIGYPDKPLAVPEGTEVVVVPGVATLSDRQIAALVELAKGGMKMVVTGDAGRYNEWNAQRRTNTFLPQLVGLPNVVCRAKADVLPKAIFGWGYKVDPPTDGGAAMMADLKRVGWRAPVDFENLPPHVFAEYRRLADGSLAVHLLNYMPEQPIMGAKLRLPKGATAAFEAPLGKNPARVQLADGATLPDFVEYALMIVKENGGTASAETAMLRIVRPNGTVMTNSASLTRLSGGALRFRMKATDVPAEAVCLEVLPDFMTAHAGEAGFWVLPDGRYGTFRAVEGTCDYGQHPRRTLMPIHGMKTPRGAYLAIVRGLRHDCDFLAKSEKGVYSLSTFFRLDELGGRVPYEDLVIDYIPLSGDEATYAGMARYYRNERLSKGDIRPLSERIKDYPTLAYTAESIFVRVKHGWKALNTEKAFLKKHEWQSPTNEPPVNVSISFARYMDIMRQMKKAGIEKAEMCSVGGTAGGFDGRFPDVLPLPEAFGGTEKFMEAVKLGQSLGFQMVAHFAVTAMLPSSRQFNQDDICWKPDGSLLLGGIVAGGRTHRLCPRVFCDKMLARDWAEFKSLGLKGTHHVDVVSCIPPYACYNPKHPLNFEESAACFRRIGEYSREVFGGFGSESGFDWMAPALDFALYISWYPGARGREGSPIVDRIVPFWQLVYHGIIISNPFYATIDAYIDRSKERLNFSDEFARYGYLDDAETRILKLHEFGGRPVFYYTEYNDIAPLKRAADDYGKYAHLQYAFMDDHRELEKDIYLTRYSTGEEMITNYSDRPYEWSGVMVPARANKLIKEEK